MKRDFLYLGTTILLLTSCGNPEGGITIKNSDNEIVQKPIEQVKLEPTQIYVPDAVLNFVKTELTETSESQQLFLKGVDFYKNKHDLDSALITFESAALEAPSAQLYFELGCVNREKNQLEKAKISFELAEQLGFEPFNKILYNLASIFSLEKKDQMAQNYLKFAIQAGFTDIDYLKKDESFEKLRENYEYKQAIEKGLRGISDPRLMQWVNFKKLFPPVSFPLEPYIVLDEDQLEKMEFISYDFERFISEMRDEKFSREVSKGFYYVANIFENENYVALLYLENEEFYGGDFPVKYKLATFTTEGKLIDKMIVEGMLSNEAISNVKFFKNGKFETIKTRIEFERDVDSKGYYENPMLIREELSKSSYQISPKGKITLKNQEDFIKKEATDSKDVANAE